MPVIDNSGTVAGRLIINGSEEVLLIGVAGPQGPSGPQGPQGPQGLPGTGGGTSDHALLSHLDYAASGHTGFVAAAGITAAAAAVDLTSVITLANQVRAALIAVGILAAVSVVGGDGLDFGQASNSMYLGAI